MAGISGLLGGLVLLGGWGGGASTALHILDDRESIGVFFASLCLYYFMSSCL